MWSRRSKVKEEIANSSTQMGARNQGQSATAVRVGISPKIRRAMSPVSAGRRFSAGKSGFSQNSANPVYSKNASRLPT
jgi:hypothetical protein